LFDENLRFSPAAPASQTISTATRSKKLSGPTGQSEKLCTKQHEIEDKFFGKDIF
jgi:hypothetical protein